MVKIVRCVLYIPIVVCVLLFWFDTSKAAALTRKQPYTPSTDPKQLAKCQDLYQGISYGTKLLPSEYDHALDKIKVCGASPGCDTCVEMYPGDCGYVFPTNVTVVARKKWDGNYICACQTFACNLPWDPAKWNKKCFTELGCLKQRPRYENISIEQALCGGGVDGISVKFSPLTFSKQSYFTPGLATAVLREGEKVPFMQYELIKRFISPVRQERKEAFYNRLVYADEGRRSLSYGSLPKEKIPHHNGAIKVGATLARSGTESRDLYYTAYRNADSLCIKYTGRQKAAPERATSSLSDADFDTCVPIPMPEKPVLYVAKPDIAKLGDNQTHYEEDARKREVKTCTGYSPSCTAGVQYLCMQRGEKLTDACFSTYTAVQFSQNVKYVEDCAMAGNGRKVLGDGARIFPGYVFNLFKQNQRIGYEMEDIDLYVVGKGQKANTGECRVVEMRGEEKEKTPPPSCEYINGRVTSEYLYTFDRDYAKTHESARISRTTLYQEDYNGPYDYHAVGEVLCVNKMPQGNMEFEVSTGVSKDCGSSGKEGTPCEKAGARLRVRKVPKMLRRYVMVGDEGDRKRIRCDDRYSIDLYTLSQSVLDKSIVHGNRFVLPKEYLASTVSSDTDDPCYSSKSDIVYFYEDGGFIADADLTKCGNPVEEYYAHDKVVKGCEYSYLRVDNHEPFFPEAGASMVPMSRYEQGLCVDNFSRILFEPTSTATGSSNMGCCKNAKDVADSSNAGSEYRFPIRGNSFPRGKTKPDTGSGSNKTESSKCKNKCTFYKVEMWGGGEGAELDNGAIKRSGRPGQYVSLLLDLKNIGVTKKEENACTPPKKDKKECNAAEKILAAGKEFSLVMRIGLGGKGREQSDNTDTSTRGGDTILFLCKDKVAEKEKEKEKAKSNEWPYKKMVRNVLYTNSTTDSNGDADCYEVARAVGGGSDIIGEPWYYPDSILKYYRSVTADVLKSDLKGVKLLSGGNAMFTKIPTEVNMYANESFVTEGIYLAQRSLPRKYCKYRESGTPDPKESDTGQLIIPGMGGCWKNVSSADGTEKKEAKAGEDKPGYGRNGAVIITCERWGVPGKDEFKEPKYEDACGGG